MTPGTPTPNIVLAPIPKRLAHKDGCFSMKGKHYILLDAEHPQDIIPAAIQTELDWEITASPKAPKDEIGLVISLRDDSDIPHEGYKLRIKPAGIEIVASSPAGAFYGACTLAQIVRQFDRELPCLSITDWPNFANRGVMLDISRDKVPTMDTLYRLVDMLASWKINQFQLYTEHAFAYHAHPVVWHDASPMTGEQILQLDNYCKSKFIELVPNQNSFGHLERWLKHDAYRPMAESPNGGETAWGYRPNPGSLCPIDKRSIPFIDGLYEELLPHFSSKFFTVGLDETVDIGYGRSKSVCKKRSTGRVYLDFLLQIHELVSKRNRTMMFWGDIINKHPELICELPKDIVALEWGYEHDHPFKENSARFAESGVPFYICPGASNWNTVSGRTKNAVANITSAARNGLANGAIGLLNTSWGDNGHWDPLPVAYLGFMAGAMASWNAKADIKSALAPALSIHAFGDSTGKIGQAFCDLGNLYLAFKKTTHNSSVLWQMLFKKLDDPAPAQDVSLEEFDEASHRLDAIESAARGDMTTCEDADIVRAELEFVIQALRLSIDAGKMRCGGAEVKGLCDRLSNLKEWHRKVWLMRNRPGGLEDSVAKIMGGE